MKHESKTAPEYLENLISGIKKSIILRNDQDYQRGDILEFDLDCPTGNLLHPSTRIRKTPLEKDVAKFKITHIHSGSGMEKGFVVLSVEMNRQEKSCGFCEFYDPFCSDIFQELTSWGDCDVKDESNVDSDSEICDKFELRKDREKTARMIREGAVKLIVPGYSPMSFEKHDEVAEEYIKNSLEVK